MVNIESETIGLQEKNIDLHINLLFLVFDISIILNKYTHLCTSLTKIVDSLLRILSQL